MYQNDEELAFKFEIDLYELEKIAAKSTDDLHQIN